MLLPLLLAAGMQRLLLTKQKANYLGHGQHEVVAVPGIIQTGRVVWAPMIALGHGPASRISSCCFWLHTANKRQCNWHSQTGISARPAQHFGTGATRPYCMVHQAHAR